MILREWDAPEGDPGQICVHLFARILWTSFTSVSIFSVCCYSIVSISMVFNFFGLFVKEKITRKIFLAFMKTLLTQRIVPKTAS
jgi:hypothetical protein